MKTPRYALSIRQPWADRILFDGKDIENRTWRAPNWILGKRIWVHAGKRPEGSWEKPRRLGAILGEVTIVECVTASDSEWFVGPVGFVLADPEPYWEVIPCRGRLGFFRPDVEIDRRRARGD